MTISDSFSCRKELIFSYLDLILSYLILCQFFLGIPATFHGIGMEIPWNFLGTSELGGGDRIRKFLGRGCSRGAFEHMMPLMDAPGVDFRSFGEAQAGFWSPLGSVLGMLFVWFYIV